MRKLQGAARTHTSPIRGESLRLGSVLLPPHGVELGQIVALHGLGRLQLLLPQRSLLLPLQLLLPLPLLLALPLSLPLPLALSLPLPLQLLLALPLPLAFPLPLLLPLRLPLSLLLALAFPFALPLSLPQLILQLEPEKAEWTGGRERVEERSAKIGKDSPSITLLRICLWVN